MLCFLFKTCPTPQAVKARLVEEFERYCEEMAACKKDGRPCKPRCLVLDGSAFALIEDAPITSLHGPMVSYILLLLLLLMLLIMLMLLITLLLLLLLLMMMMMMMMLKLLMLWLRWWWWWWLLMLFLLIMLLLRCRCPSSKV